MYCLDLSYEEEYFINNTLYNSVIGVGNRNYMREFTLEAAIHSVTMFLGSGCVDLFLRDWFKHGPTES